MANLNGLVSSYGSETTTIPFQEIVPAPPAGWTKGYTFKEFSFYNENGCTVIINGREILTLSPHRGLNLGYNSLNITSVVVVEQGTIYEFIAGY